MKYPFDRKGWMVHVVKSRTKRRVQLLKYRVHDTAQAVKETTTRLLRRKT